MRTRTTTQLIALATLAAAAACAKALTFGPVGEGSSNYPSITAVDSATPPKSMSLRLDHEAYVVVLLVAPGHSASILYPRDSTTNNQHSAGTLDLAIQIPAGLVRTDSAVRRGQGSAPGGPTRGDTSVRRTRGTGNSLPPLAPLTPTYLLVITSPQPIAYARVADKTVGVSIPLDDNEALNAVGKAVKSTLVREPREWAGYYQQVTLQQAR